jgi:hypothetical protein
LRTVSAILRTSTGLDGEQPAHLHFIGRVELAVYFLRLHKKIEQRLIIDCGDFLPCPIRTHGWGFIDPFQASINGCLKLQEVAFKALDTEKLLVVFPAERALIC